MFRGDAADARKVSVTPAPADDGEVRDTALRPVTMTARDTAAGSMPISTAGDGVAAGAANGRVVLATAMTAVGLAVEAEDTAAAVATVPAVATRAFAATSGWSLRGFGAMTWAIANTTVNDNNARVPATRRTPRPYRADPMADFLAVPDSTGVPAGNPVPSCPS